MYVLYARQRPRILFVYSGLSSFVRTDMEILERHFNVRKMKVTTFLVPRRGRSPLAFLRLFRGILWCDVAFSWWATLDGFFVVLFCKLLRKKSLIVIGGYEVAYVPKINYGLLLSLYSRLQVKLILEHASKILSVSRSSEKEMLNFAVPKNHEMIYNCVDTEHFVPSGQKERLVITVGSISRETMRRKRFDVFVEASKYCSVQFVLIGKLVDDLVEQLREMAPGNVKFVGQVSDEVLLRHYQKAKVYCQLSAHEGFGVALAEAMSCGCVPVVTSEYAISEVVGDTGFYVPYGNPEATAEAVRKALDSDLGERARKRIQEHFSLEKRERKLVGEVSKLTLDC